MEIAETIARLKLLRTGFPGSVGFVPTMGYLHEGHLALVKQARSENTAVIVSIFVNPSQFGPTEDFKSYPRDISHDIDLLQQINTDIIFIPSTEEMYPIGFDTWVEVHGITEHLEGRSRPSHFTGVATVVTKLFNIVQPTRAYFGQKDAQQAAVIQKMVADLNINVEIITVPTVRDSDGLAMSSRNTYLQPAEREAAAILFKALTLAKQQWQEGERKTATIRNKMISLISSEPLATIDYVSIADAQTFVDLAEIDRPALISMAIRIGKIRLIDNIIINK